MAIRPERIGILLCLAAILLGPFLSHPDYRLLAHTISGLAGQNMPGAWIMQAGLAAFGISTAVGAAPALGQRPVMTVAVVIFGLALTGAAMWQGAPIDLSLGYDARDDLWHSALFGLAGAAFALACAADILGRLPAFRPLSWVGVMASAIIPFAMLVAPDQAGLLQRAMFAISFLWIWRRLAETSA